jgi:very-short-patch-repair endonuclease
MLAAQLAAAGIGFEREFHFVPTRRYRFDFRIGVDLAVEIEGGVHGLKRQFRSDLSKHSLALLHGWRVLRVSPEQVRTGEAVKLIILLQAGACRRCS